MKKIKFLAFAFVIIVCVATLLISYSDEANMIQYASLLSAVLGVVLLLGLGLAVIIGTDGFDDVKKQLIDLLDDEEDSTEPETTVWPGQL